MDYKDAYHALRSQHSDLQRKYHDRAEELKRTNVQLSKIENLMRAMLDINLEAKQLDDLERKFRAATSGGIHYIELLNAVLPTRPTVGDNWRVEEKLRAMIKRRFEWWQPGALRRAYKHFDTKRKNKLLPADLADGLRALKVKLSAQQEQDLFDGMDLDKDGTISYTEFVVFVRDPCHPFLEQKVRYATHRAKLRPSDAEDALRDVDDNRSGLVGLRDFGVVLERLGVELTSSERKRLGRVSRKKFQRVLEDVGVDLTSRDLEKVMDKFEKRDKVDYGKFLKSIAADDDDDDVFGAIKSALKEAKDEGESPLKVFEKLDRDAAGELDADDVKRALKKLGYTPTAFELKKCKERFPGKKEDVNYEDLVGELLGSKKKRRASSDSDDESERGRSPSKSRGALKKLKKELAKLEDKKGRRLKFDKYFEAYDTEGKDYVSERDFRKALQKLGVELDDDKKAFEACASKFDKRGDGRIRWRDFVSWARDDSSSDERNPSRTRERRSRSRSRGRR